ncbi:hypothetical protein H257_02767 [Aphanomyces astaci]|uniref:Uncharacterized protein n=1 Tax=Aphanomyces astaci TaxID=112090 RepID=W4H3B5_APHAT|nr:hypothetical protein H257_02767 [Aphanomyces astaci]ETV86392.1 hypothetical protein H257_02767 [Aphanomyces astaci]|eukprot:XP_009824864.1 hypothetical protein H257_02767 [Aphanomyces astaci]
MFQAHVGKSRGGNVSLGRTETSVLATSTGCDFGKKGVEYTESAQGATHEVDSVTGRVACSDDAFNHTCSFLTGAPSNEVVVTLASAIGSAATTAASSTGDTTAVALSVAATTATVEVGKSSVVISTGSPKAALASPRFHKCRPDDLDARGAFTLGVVLDAFACEG